MPTANGGAVAVGNGNGIKAFGGTFSLVINPWHVSGEPDGIMPVRLSRARPRSFLGPNGPWSPGPYMYSPPLTGYTWPVM